MKWISGLLCVVVLAVAGEARSQECTVSAVPVQFGQYDSSDPSPVDAVGSVYVSCTSATAFTVKLDAGSNSSGSFDPRRMRSAGTGGILSYNLYRDSARAEVWGDGTGNTFIQTRVGTGGDVNLNVYGRLSGGQDVSAGTYGDTITVTVEW